MKERTELLEQDVADETRMMAAAIRAIVNNPAARDADLCEWFNDVMVHFRARKKAIEKLEAFSDAP